MGKNEKTLETITINDVEYNVDDLSPEQVALVNHVMDLKNKIDRARFNLDQLEFGKQAFVERLTESLEVPEAEAA